VEAHGRDVHTGIGAGPIDVIASWLATNIGARVVAYASGMSRSDLMRIAHGDGAEDDADRRLRNLFAVCSYMAVSDGPGTAHDFLLEPNVDLDGRTPADLLHDGEPPEKIWIAAVPTF
jgi:uncharacterized protein (DUF2384 family)